LCFPSAEGLVYSMPALIRLTLETMDRPQEWYLEQLLLHVIYDGKDNRLVRACTSEQRAFIARFLVHLMEQYSVGLDACSCSDGMLKAYEIWSTGEQLQGCCGTSGGKKSLRVQYTQTPHGRGH
jgi:hypothetical protein